MKVPSNTQPGGSRSRDTASPERDRPGSGTSGRTGTATTPYVYDVARNFDKMKAFGKLSQINRDDLLGKHLERVDAVLSVGLTGLSIEESAAHFGVSPASIVTLLKQLETLGPDGLFARLTAASASQAPRKGQAAVRMAHKAATMLAAGKQAVLSFVAYVEASHIALSPTGRALVDGLRAIAMTDMSFDAASALYEVDKQALPSIYNVAQKYGTAKALRKLLKLSGGMLAGPTDQGTQAARPYHELRARDRFLSRQRAIGTPKPIVARGAVSPPTPTGMSIPARGLQHSEPSVLVVSNMVPSQPDFFEFDSVPAAPAPKPLVAAPVAFAQPRIVAVTPEVVAAAHLGFVNLAQVMGHTVAPHKMPVFAAMLEVCRNVDVVTAALSRNLSPQALNMAMASLYASTPTETLHWLTQAPGAGSDMPPGGSVVVSMQPSSSPTWPVESVAAGMPHALTHSLHPLGVQPPDHALWEASLVAAQMSLMH